MPKMSRRQLINAGLAAGALGAGLLPKPRAAYAAPEFSLKIGAELPASHSVIVWLNDAAKKIATETDGRVAIEILHSSVLGSAPELTSQVRAGAIDFTAVNSGSLTPIAPVAAVGSIGFSFKNHDQAWGAFDNELGDVVRAAFLKSGLLGFRNVWDQGFHQITTSKGPINNPVDFSGIKVRSPNMPIFISLFEGLGASPVAIPFGETYSALQTKIADAQGQALSVMYSAKLYEVQKYLSLTRHIWTDIMLVANARNFAKLPASVQDTITKHINAAALVQRRENVKSEEPILADLKAKGLIINETKPEPFRERLNKSDYYPNWKKKIGDEAWSSLEKVVGKLG